MKIRILLLLGLIFSGYLQALNFNVLDSASSVASQNGNVIEDTVTGATGIQFDSFSYLNDQHAGAFSFEVKVKNPDLGNIDSEAGIMIRESLAPGSPFLAVVVNGNRTLKIRERWYQGSFTSTRMTKIIFKSTDFWLKIVKTGQLNAVFIKYSKNGSWQYLDNGVYMPSGAYFAGLASSNGSTAGTGFFDYRRYKVEAVLARVPMVPDKPAVFPNPGTDFIKLNFSPENIRMFSMEGKEVEIQRLSVNALDVSGLASGAYFIRADGIIIRFLKIK